MNTLSILRRYASWMNCFSAASYWRRAKRNQVLLPKSRRWADGSRLNVAECITRHACVSCRTKFSIYFVLIWLSMSLTGKRRTLSLNRLKWLSTVPLRVHFVFCFWLSWKRIKKTNKKKNKKTVNLTWNHQSTHFPLFSNLEIDCQAEFERGRDRERWLWVKVHHRPYSLLRMVRLMRLTLVCEVIRYRLVQVRQNLKI